jgi:hypothetical protein
LAARTGTNTWSQRTLQQPAAGLTITNPAGVSGDPTFALANDLAAIEALNTNAILVRTGTDTWAARTITGTGGRIGVTNGDGVSGNPTIDLATVGSAVTAQFVKITTDAYGRVTATAAVASGDITGALGYTPLNKAGDALSAGDLTLFQDPTSAMHATTKQYVDAVALGFSGNQTTVRAATTGSNITLSGGAPSTLDGVTLAANDYILVKDQSSGAENGIYEVTTLGSGANGTWTRRTGYDTSAEVKPGLYAFVSEGTVNGDNGFALTTNAPITLGSTSLTFTQVSGLGQVVAGNGMTKSGNTLNIGTASTSRIVINADDIDLGQPTIGGSGAASGITKVTVDVYGRVTNTSTATPSDIGAQAQDADLDAIAALATNGLPARTGSGTWSIRTLQQPAAGITITNPGGVAGDPTFALANDLSALEGLAANGIAARTNTDTWAVRTITGTSGRITLTNGDGVSGNPTIDLASGVATPGTYTSVTVDTYGRVTAGSNPAGGSADSVFSVLTNNQGSTINIAQVVYSDASGSVKLARSNATGTKDAIGLVSSATISNGATGNIITDGVVTATTGEWDAVTGQSGGLTTNSYYYVSSATAGSLTVTAPDTTGNWAVPVGIALSSTKMKLTLPGAIKC